MSTTKLSFDYRGRQVPVTWSAAVTPEQAQATLESKIFRNWVQRLETSSSSSTSNTNTFNVNNSNGEPEPHRHVKIESVEIQSVDMFGARGVGFAKIKSHCTLEIEKETTTTSGDSSPPAKQPRLTKTTTTTLPGICFLRGDAVAILVALFCEEDGKVYSLLVDQPRVPIGQVQCLELPAGMMDDDSQSIRGVAVKEMEEECGIAINKNDLVDLNRLAYGDAKHPWGQGVPLSHGGCDETLRLVYMEKSVTKQQLDQMRNRMTGLRHEGEVITLRVVPYEDVWKCADAKALIARFLVNQLRDDGKLPAPGKLAQRMKGSTNTTTVATKDDSQFTLTLNNDMIMPQLAFGCYKVPDNREGEQILKHAIQAGYRHFDTASYYGNEATLGRVLRQSSIPRENFFLATKVWNDAQKQGRAAVRQSVLDSLKALDFGEAWDLVLVHWPVPSYFIDTYHELELLQQEGKIRALGISNFSIDEYEALVKGGITVPPVVNQFEVSPFMYRPKDIEYFQTTANMVVSASKAMHRGGALGNDVVRKIAKHHKVTPAQVMIRWSLQKNLAVLAMSSNPKHQQENRDVSKFSLSEEEMAELDSLTSPEAIRVRTELEEERKKSM